MSDKDEPKDAARPAGVPPPPTQAHIDRVSQDQALITDEWAPAPAHPDQGAA